MTVPLRVERALLTCGVVGPPLFVVAFLVEGATRAGYDPMRHPVSALALGELWWTQTANFIVTGLLLVAFAAGLAPALRRRYEAGPWAPVLVGMMGVGLIGAGVFPTDPVSGYPAGTPMLLPVPTDDGMLHDAFSAPVFLALPVACCVVGYRFARAGRTAWAVYSFVTAPAFLAGFVLASGGFSQSPALMPIGGLLQRLTLVIGWVWLTALAAHLLRAENQSPVRGEMG
ncbi:DUF998 domain-containing protein [Nonomuraea sp. NPDC046570]|uniref:DUF998 domain-containing protein n=1 Tax=Nonomuraea sp. NPDC046570 TaxID=3155255 RepID=UPI00340064AA